MHLCGMEDEMSILTVDLFYRYFQCVNAMVWSRIYKDPSIAISIYIYIVIVIQSVDAVVLARILCNISIHPTIWSSYGLFRVYEDISISTDLSLFLNLLS